MYKILLLEDDEMLLQTLKSLLANQNYKVTPVKNINQALDETYENSFDLYLFDINVPFGSGIDLLKDLRDSGDKTPAFFITALKDIKSISKGFDAGCDDYIKKPFDFDELLIRINALLRKAYHTYANEIKVDDFRFVIESNELYKKEKFIPLSPYELKITKLLFQNLEHTLEKEVIFEHLAQGKEMSEGSLRVYINKLRKIGLPIITIKGIGYRLANI